jgi:glucose/arabinose dehydrogenase
MRLAAQALTALSLSLSAPCVLAQTVPTGFTVDTLISTGLTAPNDFCFLPDGRILIANRPGGVTIYASGATATVGTVPGVEVGSERALLSIAADPQFATNGYIYVWYSSSADAFMHLDRFTCTGDLAVATSTNVTFASTSRRVILTSIPDNAFNHNGGTTRFGPDGMLYQSFGDDATGCPAQTLTSQVGALLRMNVSGLGAAAGTAAPTFAQLNPGTNPLSAATDFSQLVLCHGLRNPVRFTIDPQTNNLYIGDVGQNAHEEYDEYTYSAGALTLANYGWPWREGNFAYTTCTGTQPANLINPIVDVPQAGNAWYSIMGGPRYRNRGGNADFGPTYEGVAFYGDYFAGQIRVLQKTGSTWAAMPAVAGQPSTTNWAQGIVGLVSMDVGPDGGLYVLHHPSTYATTGGFLKRIRALNGPLASAVSRTGAGNLNTSLSASAPRLGSTATMSIITFGSGYNAAAAYGFTTAATLPFNGYTILVDTNSLQVLELPLQVAPIAAQWSYVVPNITALAGLTIKTQGLMLGSTFALTNAMDLVVGN